MAVITQKSVSSQASTETSYLSKGPKDVLLAEKIQFTNIQHANMVKLNSYNMVIHDTFNSCNAHKVSICYIYNLPIKNLK